MPCPFCDHDLSQRTFFRGEGWVSFFDANPILPGHTILAREPSESCPNSLDSNTLAAIHVVLPRISEALKLAYGASNVLVTSLRGAVKHVHFHLVPVTPEIEQRWRDCSGWKSGHLHEFLGHHETVASVRNLVEREQRGWSEEQQRFEHTKSLEREVARVKPLLGGATV